MKKYTSIGLSILILASLIIATALTATAFYDSLQQYRSPLRRANLVPQPPIGPHSTRVVIVLISGLGDEAARTLDLPVLAQLRQAGASTTVQSLPPTYTQTAWATLVTGAPPETNDAAPLDLPTEEIDLLQADTLFARAHEAGLRTAILGSATWRRLIPRNDIDYTFLVNEAGPAADEAILEATLPLLAEDSVGLILVHFSQVDFAATTSGGASGEAYAQAANRVDTYLGQLSGTMDFNHSVLVVTADHGHIAKGGHGGTEEEVIWQPLVMIGEKIVPGVYSNIYQSDLSPTISTILGLAPPAASQGHILYDLLRVNEYDRATAQLALARQRVALAEAYLARIEPATEVLTTTWQTDLARAQAAFDGNNIGGAFQLATLAQQEADSQMVTARSQRTLAEQVPRLALVLLLVLVWFTTMWRRRGRHLETIIIAAMVTVALYHALYWLQGYSYSLSSLKNFSDLPLDIIRRVGVSSLAGGGIVLVLLMLAREENWLSLLGTGYGFGVLVTFVFSLPLFWAFWQNGFTAAWRLPDSGAAFWLITGSLETLVTAIFAISLPWPIMSLNLLINLIRHYLDESKTRAKSDTLPGLHLYD